MQTGGSLSKPIPGPGAAPSLDMALPPPPLAPKPGQKQ
jgi:hypothetical protein